MTVRYRMQLTSGDDAELVAARLWQVGAMGVQELPDGLVAWFPGRTEDVPPGGRWAVEPQRDWMATWREGIEPVVVDRVHVVPSWLADGHEVGPRDVMLRLDPGVAFGSGHHATTALCLELLQDVDPRGRRVVDVGTGTGVLAIAAALLGAREVVGVDVDPQAVDAAERNAAANAVEVVLRRGGVETVGEPGEVVLANLLTPTLVELAGPLSAATAPGGLLITSGVASERADLVADALAAAGAPVERRVDRDGWAALLHRRGGRATLAE